MTKFYLLILAIVLSDNSGLAAIRRAGSGGNTASLDFADLQGAYDASAPGDTIYVYPGIALELPSNGGYLRKRIVLVGPGYFLDPADPTYPGNSGLQVFTTTTTAPGRFRIDAGSDGSQFYGCNFAPNGDLALIIGPVSNILFKRCRISTSGSNYPAVVLFNCNNITFQQCIIDGGFAGPGSNVTVNNLTISNCLLLAPIKNHFQFDDLTSSVSGVIQNCIFETSPGQAQFGNGNWLIQNCISEAPVFSGNNIIYINDIGSSTQFPSGNGNQQNIPWNTVFTGTGSWDGKYMLKPGSPAIAAGAGGVVDCGIFGAPAPYQLSGIPPFPTIYALTSPQGHTPLGNSIQIAVSTRSNN